MDARPHDSQLLSREPHLPQISAIIPARNEEKTIEAAVQSLAPQSEVAEIIVVNDLSTDRTAEILARLVCTVPRLRVIHSDGLPDDWVGKNHAAWLGAQVAKGDWLLFTDADAVQLPGSATRALADAAASGAALVSYSPEQVTESFAERALIPFIYCRLARKFDFARVNDPHTLDAAANGQFLLIRRDAYDTIGGHRAVADSVLEDVAIARLAKRAGFRLYFASGAGIVRTRMYRDFGALWQGWTKNLYLLIGGTRKDVMTEMFFAFPWLAFFFLLSGTLVRGTAGQVLLALGILDLILRHAIYGRELILNRYSRRLIVYYVPACLLYAAVVPASAWKHERGQVEWRGRTYRAGGVQ
ncbi:MAG TPA: glycosyltransferase [Candidatus Acidoferrales bacterium]|nr:glycosyltransferase [Candidatus Acidoferrales bacterium]